MEILSVQGLSKHYEGFDLRDVSFRLDEGYIMGFIGRNGAGKTTTLKSMLGLVHADAGKVSMFGKDFATHEFECKRRVGFVLGGVDYYPRQRIGTIADVTRRFYPDWDDAEYQRCLQRFELDPHKRVNELSAGMRVKFSLMMALSHKARLLILDEPTSGLDPVSRDELLLLFQDLIEDGEHSILFSTHIITDLERCADFITYIKDGRILTSMEKDVFLNSYHEVAGTQDQLTPDLARKLIGCRKHAFGFEALIRTDDLPLPAGVQVAPTSLESIMIHIERE
jgi:ABC-2 type transport system ATP-binding protein